MLVRVFFGCSQVSAMVFENQELCMIIFRLGGNFGLSLSFRNLPGFNWPVVLVKMGDFSAETPLWKPSEMSESYKQDFVLFSLVTLMKPWCIHVFWSTCGNGIHLNKLFKQERRSLQSLKRMEARAKAFWSHRREETHHWSLFIIVAWF